MKTPLDGITVLDLSHALAGPYCSTMLADFGANVIKIEPPEAGDIARAWGAPLPGGEFSYFVSLHRNKRGMAIDFKHEQGRQLFFEMVAKADIVLENYRVGVLDRLGIGYQEAIKHNPKIIYCSISGFGQDGPYRDRPALDLILQAESGMISVTGEEGSRGTRAGVSIADLTAGMNATIGILMALRARDVSGEGQQIDVSMLEGQLSLLGIMIAHYLADHELPVPTGTAYKALLPYQVFQTKSRDLALAVGSQKLWRDFCPLMDLPDFVHDPRYKTNADRSRNRDSLIAALQAKFVTKTYDEWAAIFLKHGIPFGATNDIAEVLDHPQVKARGAMVAMEHPRAGPVKIVGVPMRLSKTPGSIRKSSPAIGEHNDEVLRELLGLDDARIAALREAGVFGSR
jgi:crotonobetainyl-CoA:carnitine CoA-transferase CaiB-like acyl-CoA transferase